MQQKSASPVISVRNVVNRFGSQTVHDGVSLDVMPGEVLGIVGGSGSGKSVLLRTMLGLHKPTSGEVLVEVDAVEDHVEVIPVALDLGGLDLLERVLDRQLVEAERLLQDARVLLVRALEIDPDEIAALRP